jgi:hypothetical protein
VTATDNFKLAFGAFVEIKIVPITARSTVTIMGKMRLCLHTLDPTAKGSLHLEKNANLSATASRCTRTQPMRRPSRATTTPSPEPT